MYIGIYFVSIYMYIKTANCKMISKCPSYGGTPLLDQFILGVVRFQVACSARFNDLQHTSTGSLQVNSSTVELSAWQTKTVSAFKMKKSPVPLIAPKYSFTGHDWWTPLTIAWRKMHALEAFVNSDYLIPTLSKDGLGLIPPSGQTFLALLPGFHSWLRIPTSNS